MNFLRNEKNVVKSENAKNDTKVAKEKNAVAQDKKDVGRKKEANKAKYHNSFLSV